MKGVPGMEPIISFRDFSFQYFSQKEPTLKHISLDIMPGEKVLICGPSGSGKSTLAHCINGLIPHAYQGEITGSLQIGGTLTAESGLFERSRLIGTVLQDSDGQFIGLTSGEDIAFALENEAVAQSVMKQRVLLAAKEVGMDSFLEQDPHELSGGQKQRVSLAGVMVEDAEILLFDEPLANLDPLSGTRAVELIDRIHKTGKTVLIIEHRLEDILHCPIDRIILIGDGEIRMDGTSDQVLASGLLREYGIREPLYISALRYAGVPLRQNMGLSSLRTLDMEQVRQPLLDWAKTPVKAAPSETKAPLLEIEHVTYSYDGSRTVLKDVSAVIHQGELIALAGRNGAGKSTLSSLIAGFIKPDSGRILLNGKDLKDETIAGRAARIGVVMQNPNHMISKPMIYDEIAMGLRLRNIEEAEAEKRVLETMEICGLLPFRNWPVSALSYGQKKRVTIASILVLKPEILILDEPTAGQDYRHYSEFMSFLRHLNRNGQTILLITHDMHLMLEYAERAIVLSEGVKIADQKAYEVLCDAGLSRQANLKETSLLELAQKTGIDPLAFVRRFIGYEAADDRGGAYED